MNFNEVLKQVKEDLNKPFVPMSMEEWNKKREAERLEKLSKNPFKDFQLTRKQKEVIINYMLSDLGKGVFEGEELWEGVKQDEVDDLYEVIRDQADDFFESCRLFLLKNINEI